MITNLLITALVLTNGVAAGSQELEIVPIYQQKLVKTCIGCRNGWTPVECACECVYTNVPTGMYTVVPWVEPKKKGARK